MESVTPQPAPSRSFPSREDCWSEEATSTLVDAWGRKFMELNRGNLRQKDWQEVADAVNALHGHAMKSHRTDVQCKNRIDTLKKKYKTEKAKIAESNGKLTSSWPFFSRVDFLIGSNYNKSQIQPQKTTMTPLALMNSPPMAVPLPNRKLPQPLFMPPPPPLPQVKLAPVILPQKRPLPVMDGLNFRRNYSAIAAAAAKQVEYGGESSEEEMDDEVVSEETTVEQHGIRSLAKAIERFGEIYERVEMMKQKQMVELEKQRMQFAKELEVQRIQLFRDTQVQLEQLKQAKRSRSNESLIQAPNVPVSEN